MSITRDPSRKQTGAPSTIQTPQVPLLNISQTKHEFGTPGGIDASVSTRAVTAASLPVAAEHPAHNGAANFHKLGSTAAAVAAYLQQHLPHLPDEHPSGTATSLAAAAISGAGTHSTARPGSHTEEPHLAWESGPITPAQALSRYSQFMTAFEQSEVLDMQEVFFVGRSGSHKVKGNPNLIKGNFGYDDDRGDYNIVMHDHLLYRFEVLSILGKGSFGQVVKCHDFKTSQIVAVKIIRNKKRFQQQATVELKLLEYLRDEDGQDDNNVIHVLDHFNFRGHLCNFCGHLCIVFEPLAMNLYDLLKQGSFSGLALPVIRKLAHQLLVCLKFIKDLDIVHCDLKPENVMLRHPAHLAIKVIDFGSACMASERVYTYIQSRFYRAPEVILGLPYGPAIDMWSFGAILAELCTGCPLFPGEDESDQIQCMMEVLGSPPTDILEDATRSKLFFDADLAPRITVNSKGRVHSPGARSLPQAVKCSDTAFLDLLQKCLTWSPDDRITPRQALQHPWVTGASETAPVAPASASSGLKAAARDGRNAGRGSVRRKGGATVATAATAAGGRGGKVAGAAAAKPATAPSAAAVAAVAAAVAVATPRGGAWPSNQPTVPSRWGSSFSPGAKGTAGAATAGAASAGAASVPAKAGTGATAAAAPQPASLGHGERLHRSFRSAHPNAHAAAEGSVPGLHAGGGEGGPPSCVAAAADALHLPGHGVRPKRPWAGSPFRASPSAHDAPPSATPASSTTGAAAAAAAAAAVTAATWDAEAATPRHQQHVWGGHAPAPAAHSVYTTSRPPVTYPAAATAGSGSGGAHVLHPHTTHTSYQAPTLSSLAAAAASGPAASGRPQPAAAAAAGAGYACAASSAQAATTTALMLKFSSL